MSNQTIVLSFFQAADRGDFTAVEKFFGPRHKFHSPMGPVAMDTQQHVGLMKAFHAGFSNTHHEPLDVFESGNKVVLRGIWHGSHTGTFNNIPPSGNDVHLPFICILEVENGELINQWIEMDSMTMLIQMGAMQMPAEAAAN